MRIYLPIIVVLLMLGISVLLDKDYPVASLLSRYLGWLIFIFQLIVWAYALLLWIFLDP